MSMISIIKNNVLYMFRKVLFITIITVQGLSAQTPTASENYTMHRVMLDD